MKYTIEGFDQMTAIELGLDVVDLAILRWFVDFSQTGKMVKMTCSGAEYCWVNYKGILEDMPILNIKKDTLYRRMNNMSKSKVLDHEVLKQGGTFSLYKLGENYIKLVDRDMNFKTGGTDLKSDRTEINPNGYGNKSVGGTEINPEQNIILQNKTILQNNKKENKKNPPHQFDSDALIAEYQFADDLAEKVREWVVYKIERKETYKPTGFKNLLTQIHNNARRYGKDGVIEMMELSMANNWKGIFFEKLEKRVSVQDSSENANAAYVRSKEFEDKFENKNRQFESFDGLEYN